MRGRFFNSANDSFPVTGPGLGHTKFSVDVHCWEMTLEDYCGSAPAHVLGHDGQGEMGRKLISLLI